MAELLLLNKPQLVLSQFTDDEGRQTLSDFIKQPGFYPAGRLDYDSEGLLLLTNDGQLNHTIAHPKKKLEKCYWVQVEGVVTAEACQALTKGVLLKDGPTRPAKVRKIDEPRLWRATKPIRERKNQPTSWLEIKITEGRNRQVRRMTAKVGFPTLRLIRVQIGPWRLEDLMPGEYRQETVNLPSTHSKPARSTRKRR